MSAIRLIVIFGCFALATIFGAARAQTGGQFSHFPSPHQPWSTGDYVDFYFAHFNGNRALPHLRSQETARLFERIVSRDNVRIILEGSMPQERKRADLALILATMGEIRAAYNYALFVGEPLSEELTRIQSFMLFLIDLAVRLESDGGSGASTAAASAWKTTLWNVVASLSEQNVYSGEQIASLANALNSHYPRISTLLSDADKQRFRAHIGELAARQPDSAARQAQRRLLRTALGN
jgi:hypothetical protein